jgi:hypothetical protein
MRLVGARFDPHLASNHIPIARALIKPNMPQRAHPVARNDAKPSFGVISPVAASHGGRIDYVDAVRVILILLVVAHHSIESYVTAHPPEVPLSDPHRIYRHFGVTLQSPK